VTDLVSSHIKKEKSLFTDNACIFGCGPLLMTAALADIADIYGISCQVSLESKMACGTGACLGCAVKTMDGSDSLLPFSYSRVCSEGPVFDSRKIL
jgi:dihydroorotate dehydrogenase electron transfer subunit